MVRLKRIYLAPAPEDGERILVERLWPRGLKKEDAAVDLWFKDVAPSPELRTWFGHDPAKWQEFQRRYRGELAGKGEVLEMLRQKARQGPVTLVYAARDEAHNAALALKKVLEEG